MGVELRRPTEEDLPTFFDQQLDREAQRMAVFVPREREAFLAHWANILANRAGETRTILADGRVAGNIVSFDHGGRREVGYWIGREHWGRGVATAALTAFLQVERRRPLFAGVAKHNLASLRVLEKCGFTVIGEDAAFATVDGEAVPGLDLRLDA